jgi:hypothetical protein
LLLQRLTGLSDEPRILHCDHRLRREVFQQRDLLVGKRPDFAAMGTEISQQDVVLAHRHR